MEKKQKQRKSQMVIQEQRAAYICLIPAFLGLSLITYLPLLAVFGIGFTDLRIGHFVPNMVIDPPKFVGFENFINIFTNPTIDMLNSIKVTLYYALFAVVASIIYSMIIALLLNRKMPGRAMFRSIFYLPYILPSAAVVICWSFLLRYEGGLVNIILQNMGFDRSFFFSSAETVIPTLVILAVWQCGNLIVIFLAGLQNVPRVYMEAAEIDGANFWQRFWNVTIPQMTPIIFFNMLMSLVANIQIVVPALSLTRGGPGNSTTFMTYIMYQEGFQYMRLSTASAIAAVFFLVSAVIAFALFITSSRWIFYEGGDEKK